MYVRRSTVTVTLVTFPVYKNNETCLVAAVCKADIVAGKEIALVEFDCQVEKNCQKSLENSPLTV